MVNKLLSKLVIPLGLVGSLSCATIDESFGPSYSSPASGLRDKIQVSSFQDLNGDGETDFVYVTKPKKGKDGKLYCDFFYRERLSDGGFGEPKYLKTVLYHKENPDNLKD